MKKFAIYGKGGIGKSTVTSHISAALATLGYRVLQIGCDPKADSTSNLLGGRTLTPVTNFMRLHTEPPALEDIMVQGYGGVWCVEAGGPTPGMGCAGRGILTTFNLLEELDAYGFCKPDFVLYDVLGDVVCGGFAAPIRDGYADKVIIVTSGEKMSLFAAHNIAEAVRNFADRGYASMHGIIVNRRNIEHEDEIVRAFAEKEHLNIITTIPRDGNIQTWENQNRTTVEGDPTLPISQVFLDLARKLAEA